MSSPLPPVEYATTADGVRIAFMRWPGTSPPFLALYVPNSPPMSYKATGPGYAGWWRKFARGRSWATFDFRGSGASGPITGTLTNDHLALDVEAVASRLGEPVDAVAVGRACFPLLTLAARLPELFRSLWIMPLGVRYEPSDEIINRPGWELNYRDHLRSIWLRFGETPAEADRTARIWEEAVPKESFAAYLQAARMVDLSDVLPRIEIPTWVGARKGEESGGAAEVAALMPNATLSFGERGLVVTDYSRDDWDANLGARVAAGEGAGPPPALVEAGLTSREVEVLQMLAEGRKNADIAMALTLSVRTVEHHVASIRSKIGVGTRAAAAAWAVEHGLVLHAK